MFRPVSADLDFVKAEAAEQERWRKHRIFERSIEQRQGAPEWIFYEGPPTANGKPGLHHVWARVYKDLFCRFQTMRGRRVDRRAGWDTHGLPVEVEVEKRLGISGKQAIEDQVGVLAFTKLCRESVMTYVGEFERLTERIGYWVDTDDAYFTFHPSYVESVWWQLQQIFNQGLLYEDLKVIAYCPRCGTPLSSHELGQPDVYRDEADDTCYIRLRVTDAPAGSPITHLAIWTTTPWTLLSNAGVAVNPELRYAIVDGTVVAESLVSAVFGDDAVVHSTVLGRELLGLHYERPFSDVELPAAKDACVVVGAEYVTTEDGTGLVHQAPAFGEVDRQVARDNGLPTVNPVGPDGTFTDEIPWLAGRDVRASNGAINDELERRGLLIRREEYVHSLPHCWRCQTVLIYWGKPSWYIATSQVKDRLVAENQKIDWHPQHIRDGRFGEWLSNNVDWALSRDRYWGTPLPIWKCEDGHLTCVGSRGELTELSGQNWSQVDPHRPAIDEVTFPCPHCQKVATRVAPVIDAWFDSGAMPAAQVGFPHVAGSESTFKFPAQFIAEGIDQTRGWFYSLLAVNTLVFGQSPYEHVLCLGHLVDESGRKMSKSLGNVIDPWEILDARGADAMRWWMFSQGSPWTPTRSSFEVIDQSLRETLGTLWNTVSFFCTYASLNQFDPADPDIEPPNERGAMDRWIHSRVWATLDAVTTSLDGYEPLPAADAIGQLIDDLSNWYVRVSRRRFWRTDPSAPRSDSLNAQATLLTALTVVTQLLAPLCPFIADRMFRELDLGGPDDSVHLANWRTNIDGVAFDADLEAAMHVARQLTSLGRKARAEANIRVRQPLRRALAFLPPDSPRPPAGIVEDELNVDVIEYAHELSEVMTVEVVPNFRVLGPRLGEAAKEVRAALSSLDPAEVSARFDANHTVTVSLSTGAHEIGADDVELRVRSQGGFSVSRDGGAVVALDLVLDDDLRHRGLLRELVRQIQDQRKQSGFHVADRITVVLNGLDDLSDGFDELAAEVLAVSVSIGVGEGPGYPLEFDDGRDARVWIAIA